MKDKETTIAILMSAREALADCIACFESAAQNQVLEESRKVVLERVTWYRNTHTAVCAEINALRGDVR